MAAVRGKPVKPHPAVTALLLLLVVGVLSLFPIALYANAMEMADGYRASHGQAGTPGNAMIDSAVDGKGGQVCRGVFTPDGGAAVEVRIEVDGECEEGQEVEARLMEGRSSMFTGYGEPRAWAAGADDWAGYLPLVVLFGLLSLPLVLLAVAVVVKLAKLVFLPREAPKA
ncbi:hypothetical protein [Glycomyces algeriensis]|uniref:Uncharacterized protein n=1 Tax=Glycomyces algeriensis TaxID=256037 RepID=A0A9W6G9J1_9ACTN|nr:hypothetical protein [Glycomyces algeriensis]MDA1369002.1 hypothetical protein [Glycomyces algeriensis]MDR7350153.1 hypothetical protein [Glycomyces algeriensis]GLI42865.1 hypothetical protein GALLR39Z86_27150 [Glycomyces algeriensis]